MVLVGDTGVGKTGLGIVLSGGQFVPTESTHGRHVWTLHSDSVETEDGKREFREVLLWDLAGQPGYRLVHQLSFNEVSLALVLFDARSELDPFGGVRHWSRALRLAERAQADSAIPIKKFLVQARSDRGIAGVSQSRIDALMRRFELNAYFRTSAKEGDNIQETRTAILGAIDWGGLPRVISNELFYEIKSFLISEKKAGTILSTIADLFRSFGLKHKTIPDEPSDLKQQFDTCITLVESRGLIRRLSFGGLLLLQPELLDNYVAAILNAARADEDGSITEEDAREGKYRVPEDIRIKDPDQDRLLLLATIEELVRQEIALREPAQDGHYLVFPSQFTREWPDSDDPKGRAVVFEFEGPMMNVYSTLVVRLAHSGVFHKAKMWRNAVIFKAQVGGNCGIHLREVEDGRGEMTLFFTKDATEATRFQFEEYVRGHLLRRALPETVCRIRVYECSECGIDVSTKAVIARRQRGYDWIACNVCGKHISILDREERLKLPTSEMIAQMNRHADEQRERDTAAIAVHGKVATGEFDVFLCFNSSDRESVRDVAEQLKAESILPWFDEWELRPGIPWQQRLSESIAKIGCAAVFIGKNGIGPWQERELEAFINEFVERGAPVIPVILKDYPKNEDAPRVPTFLKGMTWVDFRKKKPNPLNQLIWGITGEKSDV